MALLMANARIFVLSTWMEEARTISSLSPVARIHSPIWVLKNKISNSAQRAVKHSATSNFTVSLSKKGSSVPTILKIVVLLIRERLELLPIANKFTEYKPLMVRIPDRMGWIPNLVCKSPVTQPAAAPAKSAAPRPSSG